MHEVCFQGKYEFHRICSRCFLRILGAGFERQNGNTYDEGRWPFRVCKGKWERVEDRDRRESLKWISRESQLGCRSYYFGGSSHSYLRALLVDFWMSYLN